MVSDVTRHPLGVCSSPQTHHKLKNISNRGDAKSSGPKKGSTPSPSTAHSSAKKRGITLVTADDVENVDPAERLLVSPTKRTRSAFPSVVALRPITTPKPALSQRQPFKDSLRCGMTPVENTIMPTRIPSTAPVCRTSTKAILEHSIDRRTSMSNSTRKPFTARSPAIAAFEPLSSLSPPTLTEGRTNPSRRPRIQRQTQSSRKWFFDIHIDDLTQQHEVQKLHAVKLLAKTSLLTGAGEDTIERGPGKENVDPEAPVRPSRAVRRRSAPVPATLRSHSIAPVAIRPTRSSLGLIASQSSVSALGTTDPVKRDRAPRAPLTNLPIAGETTVQLLSAADPADL